MCDGLVALNEAVNKLDIDLVSLVAETAVWAHPKIHGELLNLEETGAYFPKTRRLRLRNGEKKHTPVNGEYVDDNTFANRAIKAAIGAVHRDIRNYAACHIWPDTCYRIDCHTVIANLVLLPSPLAALSDHLPAVINALKYRAGRHPLS